MIRLEVNPEFKISAVQELHQLGEPPGRPRLPASPGASRERNRGASQLVPHFALKLTSHKFVIFGWTI